MSKEEKILIKIQTIAFFTSSLANIFLNIFLFKIGSLKSVIQFQAVSLTVLLVWYLSSGWLFSRFKSRHFMQLAFLFYFALYLLILIFREKSVDYLVLLGIISGSGGGNFWSANNLAQYISTYKKTRLHFFGRQNFWWSIAGAFGPIIGGAIIYISNFYSHIPEYGYYALFFIVSLLIFYLFLSARKVPSFTRVRFKIKDVICHKRSRNWTILLLQQFLLGLGDNLFLALSGILFFLIVKGELALGAVSTGRSIVFAVASIFAAKLLKKNKQSLSFGTILSPLGILFFAWQQNTAGILLLILFHYVFYPFVNIPTSSIIYDEIDKIKKPWQKKYHLLIERDLALGTARILSYLILLAFFINTESQVETARKWIYFSALFPFLIGISFNFLKKN